MCGRYTLTSDASEIADEFGVEVPPDYQPHYNIAPSQSVPVAGQDAKGERKLSFLRWGLVPWWAEDPKRVQHTINARAETLLLRRVFREAFQQRRCLIVADGFYEWRRAEGRSQPFRFHLNDNRLFAFAGLWERWQGEAAEPLYSCAIVTTDANPVVAPVHDRMPVMLTPAERERWLDPAADVEELRRLLHPYTGDDLTAYAVSAAVNNAANDTPACIEPL